MSQFTVIIMIIIIIMPEMTLIDRLFGSRKEEEDLPALKIVMMHRYGDSKTT